MNTKDKKGKTILQGQVIKFNVQDAQGYEHYPEMEITATVTNSPNESDSEPLVTANDNDMNFYDLTPDKVEVL